MKEQPRSLILNKKWKDCKSKKCYVPEKILPTRNYSRKFIKNSIPEKRKENM